MNDSRSLKPEALAPEVGANERHPRMLARLRIPAAQGMSTRHVRRPLLALEDFTEPPCPKPR